MENKRIDFNLIIGFLLIGLLLYLMNNSLMSGSSQDLDSTENNIDNQLIDKYNNSDTLIYNNIDQKKDK